MPVALAPLQRGSRSGAVRGGRWTGLDALKAIGLFAMIVHHLGDWTGGRVRERWIGFEGFVVTDVAAPIFAVGLGAGAYLVGRRIAGDEHRGRAALGSLRHWCTVFAVGLIVDRVLDGTIGGGGVLYTLAVLGLLVTSAVALGVRAPLAWWGIAFAAALLASSVAQDVAEERSFIVLLWQGAFALPTYLAFAAVGAAVAASASSRGEASLPLWRAAGGIVVLGLVVAWIAPWTATDGLWPPSRYPGDLAYIVWGAVSSLTLWAILRRLVAGGTRAATALSTAGRRTLWVFALHHLVKLVLIERGELRTLTSWRWGLAAWAAAAAICALACLERPRWVRRRVSSPT